MRGILAPYVLPGTVPAAPTTAPAELEPRYREGFSRLVAFGLRWSF